MSLLIPIEEIYDAATDDACLERLAASLAQSLGARSGVVHWRNVQTETGSISISGYFSEEQMAEYDRHFSDCDLWAQAFAADGSANRVWNSEELVSARAYEGSRIYNEWIRAMGDDSFRCIGGSVRTDTVVGDIGFHRARNQPAWERDAVRELNECLGHLQRMMTIRGRIEAAEEATASAAGALDGLGYGLFTLGLNGCVIRCNHAAEAIIERGDGLIVKAGRLQACNAADQRALTTALDRAAAPSQAEASALRIKRRDGGSYEVSVVSAPSGLAGRQLLVTITDPDGRDTSLGARLRTLYGLSITEAEVAIRISEGASLAQLADERRTAIGTIRNQTKAVAEKLGCGRQAEIVAVVKSLPPLRATH